MICLSVFYLFSYIDIYILPKQVGTEGTLCLVALLNEKSGQATKRQNNSTTKRHNKDIDNHGKDYRSESRWSHSGK